VSYSTADNLAVCPENEPAAVEALAEAMGYPLDRVFEVRPQWERQQRPF
jgi:sulfite reductase alpha subunit-like flavoprotein